MPSAAQLLTREQELMTQIEGQRRRYAKHTTGANAKARPTKVALLEIAGLLQELEPIAVSRCSKIPTQAEKEAAVDTWYDYREEIQQFLFDGWLHYNQMPDRDQAAQTEAQLEIAAVKAKLTEQTKQAEAEIALLKNDFETNWVQGGRYGDPATMTRVQHIAYTERLMEIKRNIHPGLKHINDELCKIDLARAPTHQTEFTTALAEVNEKYVEVQTLFTDMEIPDATLNVSVASAGGVSSLGDPAATSSAIMVNRSLTQLATAGVDISRLKPYSNSGYKQGEPPKFYGDPARYPLFKREWLEAVQEGQGEARIIRLLARSLKCPDRSIADSVTLCETAAEAWEFLDRIFAGINPSGDWAAAGPVTTQESQGQLGAVPRRK